MGIRTPLRKDPVKFALIAELHKAGLSQVAIAARVGESSQRVRACVEWIERRGGPPTIEAPKFPNMAGKDGKEAARAHAEWLRATLEAASAANVGPKEISSLAAQYTAAMRLVTKLDGSLDITPAQIIRSADFQRIMGALKRAIGDHLEIWERFEQELAILQGEEAPKRG